MKNQFLFRRDRLGLFRTPGDRLLVGEMPTDRFDRALVRWRRFSPLGSFGSLPAPTQWPRPLAPRARPVAA